MKYKLIHLATVGSRAYGTNVVESDHDRMGLAIERPEFVIGNERFEQDEKKTDEGEQVVYSLRKFVRLIEGGNPNVTELLWLDGKLVEFTSYWARLLISNRQKFLSKRTLKSYWGYLVAQRQRLEGTRGQKDVNRPQLVEKYGYDTKYAFHAVRLGMMGQEIGDYGRLTIPLPLERQKLLLDIRNGKWELEKVVEQIKCQEMVLDSMIKRTDLPERADHEWAQQFLIMAYKDVWNEAI